jgi:hypothetical protein
MFGLIYRAQDMDKWLAVVKAVMNILTINCRKHFYLLQS